MTSKNIRNTLQLTAISCGCLLSMNAQAFSDDLRGVHLDLQNKFSVGAAWRVQSQDPALIGIGNGGQAYSLNKDDGDLAFDKGQIVSSVAKLTSDITLSRGKFGLFARGSAFFNNELNNKSFFNPANYGAGKAAPISEYNQKNHDVQAQIGRGVDWLDTYFYGSMPVLNRTFSFKLGRQVLNWGESTFVLNGINSNEALNANRARVPGFALNEVIIPTPLAWASLGLTDNTSIEGYYQLRWQRTIIDASGSYFSTNDFAGIGGTRADISFGQAPENTPGMTVTRAGDRTPKNSGQFGVALRTFLPWLNSTDLAIYAMNYHSRLPLFSGISTLTPPPPNGISASSARYFSEYPENIHLYGLSFDTTLPWGLAMQGEYSYKQGQPIQIDAVELLLTGLGVPSQIDPIAGDSVGNKYIRGWRRHGVSQADIGLTRIFGPSTLLGWDQIVTLFEAGYMHVHGMESNNVLRYDGPATDLPGNAAIAAADHVPQQQGGYATANSWGYNLLARFSYNNVLDVVNLEPTIRYAQDVQGNSPKPISDFVAGRKQVTLSMGMNFHSNWSTEVGYTNFFGAGKNNLIADRDFVDAVIKYAF
ncbi:MAG: DUF1302 domain-containing protein [Stenotrophobium sp.]